MNMKSSCIKKTFTAHISFSSHERLLVCQVSMLFLNDTTQKEPYRTFQRYITGAEDIAHWFWLPWLLWKHLAMVLNNLRQIKTVSSPGDGACDAWLPTALWPAVWLSNKRWALTEDFPEHWTLIKFGSQHWLSCVS